MNIKKIVPIVIFASLILFLIFNNNKKIDNNDIKNKNEKIVSIGGSITETIFELGLGNLVIAVDQSSTLPSIVKELPQVGYIRNISSEGVLSMMPTRVITNTDIGPEVAVNEIKSSGIKMKIYDAPKNLDDLKKNIIEIASEFAVEKNAKELINNIEETKNLIDKKISTNDKKIKMVFIMNPSNSSYTVAGSNTTADYLINILGGENIFSENFSFYRSINKEELIKNNPDVILIATHYDSLEAVNHFKKNLEFKNFKSIVKDNIISMPLSNLTMGPSFISNAYNTYLRINFND